MELERAVHVGDFRAPRQNRHRAGSGAVGDRSGRRGGRLIVLVVDRPDDLLQQILHRDEAGRAAEFVQDDREVDLLALHVGQDVFHFTRARYEERRSGDVLHRRFRSREQAAQDVLGVHDAHDVVERFAGHGIAGPAGRRHAVGRLGERGLGRERDDVGARGHHLARVLFAELEDPFEQPRVAGAQAARLTALLDQHADLLGGMHPVELRIRALDAEHAQHDARAPVQQQVEWPGDP